MTHDLGSIMAIYKGSNGEATTVAALLAAGRPSAPQGEYGELVARLKAASALDDYDREAWQAWASSPDCIDDLAQAASIIEALSALPSPPEGWRPIELDEGILQEAVERASRDMGRSFMKPLEPELANMLGRHMAHHIVDVQREFARNEAWRHVFGPFAAPNPPESVEEEKARKLCPTCKGWRYQKGNAALCPTCEGTGAVPVIGDPNAY